MTAYSFQARFIVPIVGGTKQQTIRHARKGQARPGCQLQLYYAMRTVHCRLIGTATCRQVDRVYFSVGSDSVFYPTRADGISSAAELDAFAVRDGFGDWGDLKAFWRKHHPEIGTFIGDLITWGDSFTPPVGPTTAATAKAA